ncbi:hypothetical protein Tco_0502420 [Tanacetum coccineum]
MKPQQLRNEPENEPLITFSPKSDPLHHEFTGELITIPPGIVREHEDYINRMSLLCSNSSSQSPENFHTIIESLPISTTRIEDSDPNKEEIVFSAPWNHIGMELSCAVLFVQTLMEQGPIEIFLFHFLSPRTNEFRDRVKLCDSVTKNKALRGEALRRTRSRRIREERKMIELELCTDIAKLSRKRSTPDINATLGERKSYKKRRENAIKCQ